MKKPFCRVCYKNKIGIDLKVTPSVNKMTEVSFIEDIYNLVGDEYTFLGPFKGSDKYLKIKHNVCGKTEKYIPTHFTQGRRCKNCAVKTSYEDFCRYVYDLSSGEYSITDKGKDGYLIIKNIKNNKEYNMLKSLIIQELNRYKSSLILPVEHKIDVNIKDYAIEYMNEKIWNYIKDNFEKSHLISALDIPYIENSTKSILLSSYCNKGLLKRVHNGLYTFKDFDITVNDIFESKYILRNGKRIGYWYGQSFAYKLGLIERPDNLYAATNFFGAKELDRLTMKLCGVQIVIRRPVEKVTEENYKILEIIDYLTTYKLGKRGHRKVDNNSEYRALRNYVSGIDMNEFEPYFSDCKDERLLREKIQKIYEVI